MDNEAIPYRSPAKVTQAQPASDEDENDYRTLVEVKKILDDAMDGLSKNFNAFDLAKNAPDLAVQVAARQVAYEILVPVQSMVDSAIQAVEQKEQAL